jgi:branched-chain amino acid transport system substrate-binding protein
VSPYHSTNCACTQLYPKDAPVSIFGGFGYDGVYVMARAIKDAKSTNAGMLRDALEYVTFTGVSGTYRMSGADHNGLSTFSIVVTQIENGKFTVAK